MNRTFKRALAIAAVAPLAFITSVGPAGADVDLGVVAAATPFGYQWTCEHPNYPELNFQVSVWTEGNDADSDDVDRLMVEAVDQSFDASDPAFDTTEPIDVSSIKVEYFKDNVDEFNDGGERIWRGSERIRRYQDGREIMRGGDKDDVGFIRTTVEWDSPAGFGDDDEEQLSCLVPLPNNEFV